MYRVLVDDNFDLYDEDEREVHGTYASYDEALSAARDLVDRSLRHLYRPGMSAEGMGSRHPGRERHQNPRSNSQPPNTKQKAR